MGKGSYLVDELMCSRVLQTMAGNRLAPLGMSRICIWFIFGGIMSPLHDYSSTPDHLLYAVDVSHTCMHHMKNDALNIVNNVSLKESSALVYEVECKSYIHCAFMLANQVRIYCSSFPAHLYRYVHYVCWLHSSELTRLSKYFVQRVLLCIKLCETADKTWDV